VIWSVRGLNQEITEELLGLGERRAFFVQKFKLFGTLLSKSISVDFRNPQVGGDEAMRIIHILVELRSNVTG